MVVNTRPLILRSAYDLGVGVIIEMVISLSRNATDVLCRITWFLNAVIL